MANNQAPNLEAQFAHVFEQLQQQQGIAQAAHVQAQAANAQMQAMQAQMQALQQAQAQLAQAPAPVNPNPQVQALPSHHSPKRPTFSGAAKELRPFIFLMRNYISTLPAQVDEATRISNVVGQCQDAALNYLMSDMCPAYDTVERLFFVLTERFKDDARTNMARAQIKTLKQKNTPITAHNDRFMIMLTEACLTDQDDIVTQYVTTLRPDIQTQVVLSFPTNLQDAMHKATRVSGALHFANSLQSRNNTQYHNNNRNHNNTAQASTSSASPMDLNVINNTPENRRCYNCGKTGHLIRDCKEKSGGRGRGRGRGAGSAGGRGHGGPPKN